MEKQEAATSGRRHAIYTRLRQQLREAYESYTQRDPADPVRVALEKAAAAYKVLCDQRGTVADQRRYRTFAQRFLSSDMGSSRAVASREYIAERTVYKDLDHALDDLMVLAFGVDGLNLEL